MKLCCHTLESVGLTCQHEQQQQRPDTFTAEEIRKYISSSN